MNATVERIRESLRNLQEQLEAEATEARQEFRYRLENGRVTFEEGARKRGRDFKVRWSVFLKRARPMEIISAPVIYGLIVPFAFLDLCVTMYQAICFPIYGIPKVERRKYVAVDRHKLTYLNVIQKLNCVYCGYCNGLLAYVREVAGRTEYYWCPIKHARVLSESHTHYDKFLEYGDAQRWSDEFMDLKDRARACEGCDGCHSGGADSAVDNKP